MKAPRHLRFLSYGLALVIFPAAWSETSPHGENDLKRLAAFAAETARRPSRADCLPVFSAQSAREEKLRRMLGRLVETGAPQARAIWAVDENFLQKLRLAQPAGEGVMPRISQDVATGRFVVGNEFLRADSGISAAAWFFYHNFFAAYAALHPDFRRLDAPLARGVGALAALGNTARSDLAFLPVWRQETALAALLLNAAPDLAEALSKTAPSDPALQDLLLAAMGQAGLAPAPENTLMMLGILDDSAGLPFELRAMLPADWPPREKVWTFAVENVAYPALLAEIGAAVWLRRNPDQRIVAELDDVVRAKMLAVLERDMRARSSDGAAFASVDFDSAAWPAVFGFVWNYRPEFLRWRQAVAAALKLADEDESTQALQRLEQQLREMLTANSAVAVAPAADLCALAGVPPAIELQRRLRPDAAENPNVPRFMAQISITWPARRRLPEGLQLEPVSFSGAAGVLLTPDFSAALEKIRAAFIRPGMESGAARTEETPLLFTAAEKDALARNLAHLRAAWKTARWQAGKVRDLERWQRLMTLYFGRHDPTLDERDLVAACFPEKLRGQPPVWLTAALDAYLAARADLFATEKSGALYEWCNRLMLLLAFAYESGQLQFGDVLLDDFLTVALALALNDNAAQAQRAKIFFDQQAFLPVAWHWVRDIVAIVRNNGDGRLAWVPAGGVWADWLVAALPGFPATDGFYRKTGRPEVELTALWMQLYKQQHAIPTAGSENTAVALANAAAGAGEFRLTWLLIAPDQNPAHAFSLASFVGGPYANWQNLRNVLGLRLVLAADLNSP